MEITGESFPRSALPGWSNLKYTSPLASRMSSVAAALVWAWDGMVMMWSRTMMHQVMYLYFIMIVIWVRTSFYNHDKNAKQSVVKGC